jgi:ubiquitin-conjugating enzyme E2 D/E
VKLANEDDLNLWDVTMDGPPESPYTVSPECHRKQGKVLTTNDQGGKFHIQISLPKEYPFKPPTLTFRTKIYHPNVTNDDRGAMCLGILRADEWKPPNKISDVLKLVIAVLKAPQPDDAVEAGIADEFKNNRKQFDKTAHEWVKKYAK